ncbi:S-adenosylmethionine-dependent methyltransferase [Alsobacter metallidurans]|uniref:S-adenosylmethionine-dependent methyltransferase n=1 Tax=Alsobacter metallidurans TaxID=340221 RepID=A0A917I874_9HYPH|nr:class I SAM-dependent methyltransferase [Alsobacter metallidurans]GGH20238.1 S-adenosylmethionine-dependent methyltransferase [Alsobacter metallidurans]
MSGLPGWSRGYPVTRIYPPSWHGFQAPAHLRAVCALAGARWDVDPAAPLAIAEIGCGTGYTASLLAAGNRHASVIGIDYNPAQIAEARRLAAEAGLANLRFIEADLAECGDAAIDALPEFDVITVHGVWSWVADPVRDGILRIIRRRLKAGGIALVSYNALPGAAAAMGLARLARGEIRKAGDPLQGVQAARALTERLIAARAPHLLPSSWRRVLTGDAPGASDGYLIHEFQTEHWRPSFFEDVADAMASARCDFVGSATVDENFPQMSLDPAQRALWDEAGSEAERQLIFDLCVQRAFRRDVYMRGRRALDRESAVDGLWVAAVTHAQGEMEFTTQAGVATLSSAQVAPIRASLASGPKTIAALRTLPGCDGLTASELLAVLLGSRTAAPLWRDPGADPEMATASDSAHRFNAVAAREFAPHGVGRAQLGLASLALGGATPASALELAVAQRLLEDPATHDDAALIAARLPPAGAVPAAEIMAGLEAAIADILRDKAPAWRALDVI